MAIIWGNINYQGKYREGIIYVFLCPYEGETGKAVWQELTLGQAYEFDDIIPGCYVAKAALFKEKSENPSDFSQALAIAEKRFSNGQEVVIDVFEGDWLKVDLELKDR